MELKINLPLIGKISGILSKGDGKPKDRGETTESSQSLAAAYYFQQMALERTRKARYADYTLMDDDYVEISAALDLYSDSAAKEKDQGGDPVEIKCEDPKAKNIIEEMVDRTQIQEKMWDTARNIAKMGDDFDEVIVDSNKLITRLKNLPPETMFYEPDEYGLPKDKPYVQKNPMTNAVMAEFEPWQLVHWKNAGGKKMYGNSVLRPIRRVYKQLQMMEDGMVVGRLTRSHMRYKFLVDVEGMTPEDAEEHLRKTKEGVKKKRLINPYTGNLETTQNPLSSEEDIFLTTRKDSNANVDVLQGATNLGNIRDVLYFQDKLFIGLKTPKMFYGLDAGDKAIAIEQAIQFACGVSRIRKTLRTGITQVVNHQLILLGVMPRKDLYEVHFAPLSNVDEMRKWTMEKLKAEVAQIYKVGVGVLDDEFILRNYVGVSDDDIKKLLASAEGPQGKTAGAIPDNLALRTSGSTGITTPGATAMNPKKTAQEGLGGNGFHIASLQMMNLIETLRDLTTLELNR